VLAKLGAQSKRGLFSRLKSKKTRKHSFSGDSSASERASLAETDEPVTEVAATVITLGASDEPDTSLGALSVQSEPPARPRGGDEYAWVTVYEHQRGATLLSTPYYSSQSLLPWDPPAFTAQSKATSPLHPHTMQALKDYVLPDPSWRWVSRAWMVDMRSDGAVQYDGFEYNWAFRTRHWRPRVGVLSAGGWVRRRRWVRLMVRPAEDAMLPGGASAGSKRSVTSSPTSDGSGLDDVWLGDEDDWRRVSAALRRCVRDGNKLELWRAWLGVSVPRDRRKRWTEDLGPSPPSEIISPFADTNSEPVRKAWLLDVLCAHGRDILHGFIFPDSRAQFLDLVFRAGMRDDLANSGILEGVDFYSRSPEMRAAPSLPADTGRPLAVILDAPEMEGYEVASPEAEVDARLFTSDSRSLRANGGKVHSQDDAAAELDAIEVGRKGDGSIANVLDKGEHKV